jgi:DNA-binding NarL/FixJ family response regulator
VLVAVAVHGSETAAARVILADDDVLLREGLASLLDRSGFHEVGQADDSAGLLTIVAAQRPDLVIVNIRMPPTHSNEGIDGARGIRAQSPDTGILVLSAHVEVDHAIELLTGDRPIGYLLKSRVTDVVGNFLDTLTRIARGASVVDPAVVAELLSARRRNDPLAVLSSRELEVLALMAEGRSNGGIARRLGVTEGHRRKARPQHPGQAGSARNRRRPSAGPCSDHLPGGALKGDVRALVTIAMFIYQIHDHHDPARRVAPLGT